MSEPDAVPLPREGEVFFDVRGESRTMRLSWYADSSVAVFSIWQGNRCTGTFRLPFGDLARMVETLQDGPPSRGLDQDPRHPGQPAYANAGPDPGYGYSEPAGYGPQATYAQGPGYGSGPDYETGVAYGEGPGYGYQDRFRAGAGPGDQYYGDYDRPAANAAYGPADRYGAPDYDAGVAPRYVPDVAGQAGYDQQAQDPPHAAPGYAAGSPGYAAGSPVSPGYASAAGYAAARAGRAVLRRRADRGVARGPARSRGAGPERFSWSPGKYRAGHQGLGPGHGFLSGTLSESVARAAGVGLARKAR